MSITLEENQYRLATLGDINSLDARVSAVEAKVSTLMWMFGALMSSGIVVVVLQIYLVLR
jgi:hypothetical protein